jgi:transcriptional regulator with XRE-family HTH domain
MAWQMGTSRKPDEDDRRRGQELARLRRASGMTQAELAEALGVSTQQVGKYERGEDRIPINRHELALKIVTSGIQPGIGFAEDAARFRGAAEDKSELRRLLERIANDLARCQELARSI